MINRAAARSPSLLDLAVVVVRGARVRGNMSSDEESSSHSEEEDEVGELPEIDEEEMRKIQERGGKRRFSVSSESASSVKCVELPTPPGLHAQHAPRAASRGRPLSRA